MTALSEAQLIEITARFDDLDRQIDRADLVLVEREEHFRWRAELAEERWRRNTNPERAESLRSTMSIAQLDAAHFGDVRREIERTMDACRHDLESLIEQVRQSQ